MILGSIKLVPERCPCGHHGKQPDADERKIHTGDSCTLKDRKYPGGAHDTCCSMNGTMAARELLALAQGDLAARMYDNMTAEQAVAFADQVLATTEMLEAGERGDCDECDTCGDRGCTNHELDDNGPQGAVTQRMWSSSIEGWTPISRSTFTEALRNVREAAWWYLAVGSRGFAVEAE